MASTINASTSAGGGIIQTADASGVLALQSAGTTIASVSSTGVAVTGTVADSTSTLRPLVSGTTVTAPAGATINFTGIPSWVKRITVMVSGVSFTAPGYPVLRLGTSAGVVSTGYLGASQFITNGGIAGVSNATAGGFAFYDNSSSAADLQNGSVIFSLLGSNIWTAQGVVTRSNTITTSWQSGSIALAGALDRVQLTTTGGTATLDAGSINIMYE